MSNLDRLAYNKAGMMFCAANVSAKSVIAVTTSMTGVILYNPVGSNKNLFIVDYSFVWTTAPAAVHQIGLAVMAPNITAPGTLTAIGSGIQTAQGFGHAGGSVAACYDAATLPVAPVARRWAGGAAYAATSNPIYSIIDNVDGAIMVPPGGAACLTTVTTTAVGMGSISWIELAA